MVDISNAESDARQLPEGLSELGEAALAWAARGFYVFPVCAGAKKPPLIADNLNEASCDPDRIRAWWTEHPRANIGAVPDLSGHFILDLDQGDKDGFGTIEKQERRHGALPETLTIATPKGQQLWFIRPPDEDVPSSVGTEDGVDFRGGRTDGSSRGYGMLPPSVRDDVGSGYAVDTDAPIAASPQWLIAWAQARSQRQTKAEARVHELDLDVNVDRAHRYLAGLDPLQQGFGADAGTYQVAAALRDLGLSEGKTIDLLLSDRFKISPRDARFEAFITRKVENVYKYAQNEAGAWAVAPLDQTFAGVLDHLPPEEPAEALRFKLYSLKEIRARPPIAWLLPDTLPEASLVEIFGFPQAGKTWWGLDMALHLATGHPGYSRPRSEPVDVIYFCGEGAKPFAQKRATAWCLDRGYDPDNPSAVRLHVLELAPNLSSEADLQQLGDDIKAQGVRPKAMFLDTLARVLSASGWDEVTKDLGQFIHQAERIKRSFDCTVVMLHHTPVDDDTRARGGGALNAGIAAEFRLKGNISKQTLNANRAVVWAVCTKMQDDEKDETPRFWRVRRAHGGLVLDPISQAEGEALVRQRDEPLDILKFQIDQAFAAILETAPNTAEVGGPFLGQCWIEVDEREKVAAGGYTHRSPQQMKDDAARWVKHTLNVAAAKTGADGLPALHEFLVVERNGQAKRGPRNEFLFRPRVAPAGKPLETGLD